MVRQISAPMPVLPPVTTAVLRCSMNYLLKWVWDSAAGHHCQHPERAARTPPDLERCREHHRPRGWQKIQVGEALQAVTIVAVHEIVAGVRGVEMLCLAGIGAHRLGAKAVHVALLDQPGHHLTIGPRRV